MDPAKANVSAIFNGWPADYADISRGYTFDRRIAGEVVSHLVSESALAAVILGASGVGKTTAARQVMMRLRSKGFSAWEHKWLSSESGGTQHPRSHMMAALEG